MSKKMIDQYVGKRIKKYRLLAGMTQENLGERIGVKHNTISSYESGTNSPDQNLLFKIAQVLGVSIDDFFPSSSALEVNNENKLKKLSPLKIPVLGTIHAGLPVLAEDNWEYEIELTSEITADFALVIKGDSMRWAGIYDGDLALMRQAETASHGMIVAAGALNTEWEATLKYYIQENGQAYLRAANPAYEDIKLDEKHRIIGHLVKVIKDAPSLNTYRQILVEKQLVDDGWADAITTAVSMGFNPQNLKQQIEIIGTLNKKG